MKTKIVKLVNGEELIAKVEVDGNVVRCNSCRRLIEVQEGLMFATFIYFAADDNISIDKCHVLTMVDLDERLEQKYIEHVSGLLLPPQQSKITV
jgi:hypothetical protein